MVVAAAAFIVNMLLYFVLLWEKKKIFRLYSIMPKSSAGKKKVSN